MSEKDEHEIYQKIACMEQKVDRVLRAIEGDKGMGTEGLANQVKLNREEIKGISKKIVLQEKKMTEKIQWQDKKIAGWAGFMGAFGALLGFIGAILTGVIRTLME